MFTKVLVVAFLAAFAFQASADAASVVPTRAEMKSIIDDALDGFLIIWDFAQKELAALFNKVIKLGQQAIEAGKEQLDELIGYLQFQIAALVEQAQAIGTDVTECVHGVEENVHDLYNKAMVEIQECLDEPIKNVEDVIAAAHAKLDEVFAVMEDIKQKFIECDGELLCIAGVVNEIIDLATSIPEAVTPILEQAQQVAEDIMAEVPSCIAGKVTELNQDLEVILNTVTECVKDKLPIPE